MYKFKRSSKSGIRSHMMLLGPEWRLFGCTIIEKSNLNVTSFDFWVFLLYNVLRSFLQQHSYEIIRWSTHTMALRPKHNLFGRAIRSFTLGILKIYRFFMVGDDSMRKRALEHHSIIDFLVILLLFNKFIRHPSFDL